jgi:hypothetical protein
MQNTNLASFFFGPTKSREYRDLRRLSVRTEARWARSPLARADLDALAGQIVREVLGRVGHAPAPAFIEALVAAVVELLAWEELGPVEVDWPAVEADGLVAIRVRRMLTRRARWAEHPETMRSTLIKVIARAVGPMISEIGASTLGVGAGGPPFELALIELSDAPAVAVERLVSAAYDDTGIDQDLFGRVREVVARNLTRASGLPPGSDLRLAKKVVMPTQQQHMDPSELARLYLAGTPFESLMTLPVPFAVPEETRFEHCHIVGGTGHGKTQLMQRLIYEDLVRAQSERRGIMVIDSQGDLIGKLRRLEVFSPEVAGSLADRLVVIDPADVEFPASLNLFDAHLSRLQGYRLVDQERVLNGVVELYETFFGDLLGAELTQKQGVIFKYLARLMLTIPGATIHTLMQLMEDGKPFRFYMDQLEGSARHFFEKEFFDPSFSATKKQILKRLWGVLSTPAFERMFSQPENKLDLFQALQGGKIILVSTAKDLLKREGSQLFGRFFIAMLAQAALERSTVPEDGRTPTMVYVDEAQEYFDDNVETILNQARKYRVGLTLAHQTLDQLTPRLRSVLNANTSFKCVGGVSAKDARALADDLHTDAGFIESVKRRGDRTEFAAWLKHHTPRAIRLSVPLGFLERQATLTEEAFDELQDFNRARYCGTLDEAGFARPSPEPTPETPAPAPTIDPEPVVARGVPDESDPAAESEALVERPSSAAPRPKPPEEERNLGKGGTKHRYLQALVKELAEQQGFRATIEAPLARGVGQVDVLLERKDLSIAVEVSVTTPVEAERENVRKCLAAGYDRVALVLVKSKKTQGRYREVIVDGLSADEQARVSFLAPEEIADFVGALAAPSEPTETVVKGYKVKVSRTALSPGEAKARRAQIARVVAQAMRDVDR